MKEFVAKNNVFYLVAGVVDVGTPNTGTDAAPYT
mgnify:CR=1 FL=1